MSRKEKAFYRHIYKQGKGYRIIYKDEHYGWYERIEDALYDRDRLEQVDFDIQTFCELPDIPNPYEHMKLPLFDKDSEYITHIPEKWRIQKKINGKNCYFGTYRSLEEAQRRRDELIHDGIL